MKNSKLFTALMLLVLTPMLLWAFQDPVVAEIPQAETNGGFNVIELIKGYLGQFFITQVAFAAATIVVANFVIAQVAANSSGTVKQIIALGISIALAIGGYLLQLGIFVDLDLLSAILIGLTSGLASNGVFDAWSNMTTSESDKLNSNIQKLESLGYNVRRA